MNLNPVFVSSEYKDIEITRLSLRLEFANDEGIDYTIVNSDDEELEGFTIEITPEYTAIGSDGTNAIVSYLLKSETISIKCMYKGQGKVI